MVWYVRGILLSVPVHVAEAIQSMQDPEQCSSIYGNPQGIPSPYFSSALVFLRSHQSEASPTTNQ
jgi:hypothetical protein